MKERRHAAIMFTDIVGYTALMGRNEETAFDMLTRNHNLHETLIQKHHGTLVKHIGDGTMASFHLASNAVQCAIELQAEAGSQNIPLKIGIHEGEILFVESDVYGDGVNIASRLQEQTEKGCITISDAVYRDIKNKPGIHSEFIGEKQFKNVDGPIKVYAVKSPGENMGHNDHHTPGPETTKNSIAVLPFANMSDDPSQEYFCDGMTEEIINGLSHVQNLKVIARTSAFMFKGRNEDIRDIGKKLGVNIILEGSVRKYGDNLRITAQLINASDGVHIWSEAYNRKIEDVFSIQEDISLSIVEKLKISMPNREKEAIMKRYTENLTAYNLYLKGLYCTRLFTPEGTKEAMEYFTKSLEEDPKFALAYFGMAYLFCKGTFFGNIAPNEGIPIAENYLNQALDLDDSVAEAHATKGLYIETVNRFDWEAGERSLKKAISINNNAAEAHQSYSYFLTISKRHQEAIKEAQVAVELDPVNSYFNAVLGSSYFYAHQYEQSLEVLERTVRLNPIDFFAHYELGHAYEGQSRIGEAIKEYEKAVKISNGAALAVSSLAGCYYLNGEVEKAEKIYQDLEDRSKQEYVPPTTLYSYQLIKGDLDKAYYLLEKAIEEHDSILPWLKICPTSGHTIPDKPRFNALIKKAGL